MKAIALVLASALAAATAGQAAADTEAVKAACSPDKSPRIAEIKQRGTLRWAVGIAAPFAAKDASGNYVGTEPENARELADILGVNLEIRDYSYDLLPPTVATGNADIVGAALYITDKRRQVIDFSDPYQREGQIFVVLGSRSELNSIEDMNKSEIKAVGNTGSGQVELTKKLLPNAQLTTADLSNSGVSAQFLISGQADVMMTDGSSYPLLRKAASPVALKLIGPKGVVAGDVPVGDELIEPFDVGFGVAKGDAGFLACVNAFVKDLGDSGRFKARYVSWANKMAE